MPEKRKCCICGYEWIEGQHGGHSCSDFLLLEIKGLKTMLKTANSIIHDQVVGMQAAVIDAHHNGPAAGMVWVENALSGPGNLPDPKNEHYGNANDYFSANCYKPFGPCEICGKPGCCAGQGHVGCSPEHLEMAKKKEEP